MRGIHGKRQKQNLQGALLDPFDGRDITIDETKHIVRRIIRSGKKRTSRATNKIRLLPLFTNCSKKLA